MRDRYVPFGYVEFEDLEGVFTCLRCLEAADLAGHELAQLQRAQLTHDYAEEGRGKVHSGLQGTQP